MPTINQLVRRSRRQKRRFSKSPVLDKSPFLRRLLWRWWYGRLAKKFTQRSWTFMNYGYEPEAGGPVITLDAEDEPDRLCVQLYEQVLAGVSLSGRDVVEVGSGRGGGASYLARAHRDRQPGRAVLVAELLHDLRSGCRCVPGVPLAQHGGSRRRDPTIGGG